MLTQKIAKVVVPIIRLGGCLVGTLSRMQTCKVCIKEVVISRSDGMKGVSGRVREEGASVCTFFFVCSTEPDQSLYQCEF